MFFVKPFSNGRFELIDSDFLHLYGALSKDELIPLTDEQYQEFCQKDNGLTLFKDGKFVYQAVEFDEKLAKQQAQQRMRTKINAKRDEVDAGGVFIPHLNKWIDSDDKAYQNIFGVKSTLDLLGDQAIPWTWADNTNSPINRDTLKVIVGTLLQTKQANHANAIAHKQAMMLLDNPEDYDYSTGWAKTYADHLAEVANG